MKILAVNNTVMLEDEPGIYVYKETGKFFKKLVELNNDVTVFQISMLRKEGDSFASYDLTKDNIKIVKVKRLKSRWFAYLKAFFKGIKEVYRADFIYLFYPGPICVFLALCCVVFNKKFGLYVRGEQGIKSSLSKFLYQKALLVNTISPKFTSDIKKMGGNVFTIRPMLDVSESDIIYGRKYRRKENYNILYVGRVVRDKGLFELMEAVYRLTNQGITNFVVKIVGDGPHLQALKKKAQEYKIGHKILFLGMVSERSSLTKLYSDADLFVLPSYHEGFPRVLYEAMIFGVPIITTLVGSIPYLLKNGINCYSVSTRDVTSLHECLQDILTHYPSKAQIAINGTQTIVDYLSDKKNGHAEQLNDYLNIYIYERNV